MTAESTITAASTPYAGADSIEDRAFALATRFCDIELRSISDCCRRRALRDVTDTFCDDFHDDPFSYLGLPTDTAEHHEQSVLDLDRVSDIDLALCVASSIQALLDSYTDDIDPAAHHNN